MIIAVKGVITRKKKYLFQLRDKKKNIYFPNFWGLFGGTVEKKESYEKALVREIKEETNLKVKVSHNILSTNYKIFGSRQEYKTIYFKCEIVSNNKFLLNEGQKYKFHSFDQVKKLNIVPWDLVAIHLVQISLIKKKRILPYIYH